ncbi:NADH:flavin oxidoreductase/NADH oxidase [Coriobacterium glomerans PW2]|uniref:NADH:flavin oxidoreductase/NADH oxidase n=1 Tax=Coriobacterium glomerans (strain ATCC 49209 / DSM 20642 / JCM 10262 / PW2) TaxID=700015 RepID=F2NBB8_CORGP|nr:NADH:flavin oxidoreductase [Coriobacterium glomerans]AEB06654.1 NADH:flavin oxidoreductase/NADH oxidase [Coriobacterium glomerans PW2]
MEKQNFQRFHYRSLEELRREINEEKLDIELSEDLDPLHRSVKVGQKKAENSMAILPMEGCDCTGDGTPSELTCRRYMRYASGGSGLLWWEADAVVEEGRANPRAMMLTGKNVRSFADLVQQTQRAARASNGAAPLNILQLTHSGRYSAPRGAPEPLVAYHDPYLEQSEVTRNNAIVVTDGYLDMLTEQFVKSAHLARNAGFDGVDIKAVHKYLVSELLGGYTRPGRYGGSLLERRSRFLLQTVKAVRAAMGDDFIVAVRLNAFDVHPYPYGFGVDHDDYMVWDASEPKRLVRVLIEAGADLLGLSSSNPYYRFSQWGRPSNIAPAGSPASKDSQLKIIEGIFRYTRELQSVAGEVPIVGNGYSWLRQFLPNAGAANLAAGGCGFVGQGRSAFAYPDAAHDIFTFGSMDPAKCCVACSKCTQIMRDHGTTGCVVRDSEVYLPVYQNGRRRTTQQKRL